MIMHNVTRSLLPEGKKIVQSLPSKHGPISWNFTTKKKLKKSSTKGIPRHRLIYSGKYR